MSKLRPIKIVATMGKKPEAGKKELDFPRRPTPFSGCSTLVLPCQGTATLCGVHGVVTRQAAPVNSFDLSCYMETSPSALETGGEKGKSYRGLLTHGMNGRTCLNWLNPKAPTQFSPSADIKSPLDASDPSSPEQTAWGNGIGNHNYCRNPDQSADTPWCYVIDEQQAQETYKVSLCQIAKCPTTTRDFSNEATTLKNDIGAKDCECMDQLYGSSRTTAKTAVPLALAERAAKVAGPGCKCR